MILKKLLIRPMGTPIRNPLRSLILFLCSKARNYQAHTGNMILLLNISLSKVISPMEAHLSDGLFTMKKGIKLCINIRLLLIELELFVMMEQQALQQGEEPVLGTEASVNGCTKLKLKGYSLKVQVNLSQLGPVIEK